MIDDNVLSIEPLHTTYTPRPRFIIGYVEGCTNNIWFIDIGALFNAILPMSLGPSKYRPARQVLDGLEKPFDRVSRS